MWQADNNKEEKSKGVNSTYWKDNGQSTMQRKLLFCVLCFHIPFVRKSELHYFLVGHLFFSTMPIFIIAQLNIWRDVILNIWSQYEIISWFIQFNYSVLKWKLSINPFLLIETLRLYISYSIWIYSYCEKRCI